VVGRVAERIRLLPHRAQLPLRACVGHVAAVIGPGTGISPGVKPGPLLVGRRGISADDPRRAILSGVGVECLQNEVGVGVAAGLRMLHIQRSARRPGGFEGGLLLQVIELHLATGARRCKR